MKKVIATIRLGYNQVGFYDKLTGIYLTQVKPTADIFAGMNTTQIRKSIASKRLILVSGSLDNSSLPILKTVKENKPKEEATIAVEPVQQKAVEEKIETVVEPVISKKKKRKHAEKTEEQVVVEVSVVEQEVMVEEPAIEVVSEELVQQEEIVETIE